MNNTELRKFEQAYAQFKRLLKLQGYSDATQDSYCRAIRRLAHWAGKCPHKKPWLHTHTRQLEYHPHLHFIVPGGGLITDNKNKTRTWKAFDEKYVINEFTLAKIFRAILLRAQ